MFAATMWNTVDISTASSAAVSGTSIALDWPVAIKLVIAGAAAMVGLLGVMIDPRVRGMLLSGPGLILTLLGIVFVATSIVALDEVANVCRAAALIYVGYLMFIATALATLGLRGIILATLAGSVINMLANWGMYVTGHGVFEEHLAEQTLVHRMGGLGHPNSIARVAVMSGLLCLAMLRSRELSPKLPGGRMLLIGIIVLSVMTTFATFSRTAMVAATAAAFFLLFDKIASRAGVAMLLGGVAVMAGGLLTFELVSGGGALGDSLLSVTTKTGDVQELTSATGRTDIWAESVRLIAQRPVTGWGLNSAPVLLKEFSRHTHNLVLHALLSGGLFAGVLVICLIAWNFFVGLTSEEPIVRAVSMYVLVSGIFEDTVLDTFATTSTLLWLLVLLYPAMSIFKQNGPFEKQHDSAYNVSGST